MSSVVRNIALVKQTPTKPITARVLQYDNTSNSLKLPVPFTVNSKGVLDINIQDNVVANLLTANSLSTVFYNANSSVELIVLGGERYVVSLSENVVTFLRNWLVDLNVQENPSNFTLYVKPLMTKVQYIITPTIIDPYTVAGFRDEPPSSDTYVNGDSTNNFRTGWIFKTPMTIKYYSELNQKYMYLSLVSSLANA